MPKSYNGVVLTRPGGPQRADCARWGGGGPSPRSATAGRYAAHSQRELNSCSEPHNGLSYHRAMTEPAARSQKTQTIRKAVFPAAGLGTRFLPATKAQPK